jgi:TetR/AcrR family tetracycline transcriptional repressor
VKKAKASRRRLRGEREKRDMLTDEAVVATALGLLDRDGLERFSMRSLADHLGVTTMATYYIFESKDELLAAVHQAAFLERQPPKEGGPWLDEAVALAHWVRDGYVAHPVVVPLARLVPWSTPTSVEMAERWLRVLRRGGLSGRSLARAYFTINAALTGLAQNEVTTTMRPAPKDLEEALEAAPLLQAALVDLDAIDRREAFEYTVRIILRGLSRLDSKKLPRKSGKTR